MALEGLVARIQSQAHEMRNGDYIRDMAKDAQAIIQVTAPSDSGQMVRNLSTLTDLREGERGFEIGLGDRSKVGNENIPAPRGTIQAFLDDYPQFRKRPQYRTGGKERAWWDLPRAGKEKLESLRKAGLYGGSDQGFATGKSPWFFPQEGSLDGWGASAKAAGITPTGFLKQSMQIWESVSRGRIMASLLTRTGWRG